MVTLRNFQTYLLKFYGINKSEKFCFKKFFFPLLIYITFHYVG
jgi:hypothetical protein